MFLWKNDWVTVLWSKGYYKHSCTCFVFQFVRGLGLYVATLSQRPWRKRWWSLLYVMNLINYSLLQYSLLLLFCLFLAKITLPQNCFFENSTYILINKKIVTYVPCCSKRSRSYVCTTLPMKTGIYLLPQNILIWWKFNESVGTFPSFSSFVNQNNYMRLWPMFAFLTFTHTALLPQLFKPLIFIWLGGGLPIVGCHWVGVCGTSSGLSTWADSVRRWLLNTFMVAPMPTKRRSFKKLGKSDKDSFWRQAQVQTQSH